MEVEAQDHHRPQEAPEVVVAGGPAPGGAQLPAGRGDELPVVLVGEPLLPGPAVERRGGRAVAGPGQHGLVALVGLRDFMSNNPKLLAGVTAALIAVSRFFGPPPATVAGMPPADSPSFGNATGPVAFHPVTPTRLAGKPSWRRRRWRGRSISRQVAPPKAAGARQGEAGGGQAGGDPGAWGRRDDRPAVPKPDAAPAAAGDRAADGVLGEERGRQHAGARGGVRARVPTWGERSCPRQGRRQMALRGPRRSQMTFLVSPGPPCRGRWASTFLRPRNPQVTADRAGVGTAFPLSEIRNTAGCGPLANCPARPVDRAWSCSPSASTSACGRG
jgi:hypothetical protein